jgi:hypothetical protein
MTGDATTTPFIPERDEYPAILHEMDNYPIGISVVGEDKAVLTPCRRNDGSLRLSG